jgi:hypothetical protein
MRAELTCCNDTYTRTADGTWRYPWDDPVPGARDLTLADVLSLQHAGIDPAELSMRPLSEQELAWVRGETASLDAVLVRRPANGTPGVGDLVLGMLAPELHVLTMMTVADIGELAGVSKATVDSYRYRGILPAPQATRGRTPLWSRPIVHRWMQTRPGCGWRSDLYASDADQLTAAPAPS